MFYPFTNYKTVNWNADDDGNPNVKYTATKKCFITLHADFSAGGRYGTEAADTNPQVYIEEVAGRRTNFLYASMSGTSGWVFIGEIALSSFCVEAGEAIIYRGRSQNSTSDNITLHIFELPT